ncbi:MAG: Tim44/TimA family putative adaptor protein [Alphaproteobacteria bacterium]|nr:Tim44/TimA family putative adaptor protein [Alphaproteobacteria bacterium]
MPADLIVYAIVAAGLVIWLRSILGTRNGDETQRPNPYLPAADQPVGDARSARPFAATVATGAYEEKITELAKNPVGGLSVANKAAEEGLLEILKADREFDVKDFLQKAQDAFAIVTESFAAGDRETLRDLLAPPVYDVFEQAITERESRRETLQTEIRAIEKAEITEAAVRRKTAFITIRFSAREARVHRDEDGTILSGSLESLTTLSDIWVFAHDIGSRDPRWLVMETRGDFDGDNDVIPNSH